MSIHSNSEYHEAYYNQVLNNIRAKDKSLAKVFDIIEDLTDRSGLGDAFYDIDGEIQDEIIEKWKNIIEKE